MISLAKYFIPLITLIIIVHALIKKIDIYDAFLKGVQEGLEISLTLFPSIFAIIISISVFTKSHLLNNLISLIDIPFFPKEILPIAFLRPISGSSSMILLNDLLTTYGPDSLIGKMASVMAGSTDTTIYIIAMYFSSIGIRKIRYSLLVGLLADLACVIISYLVVSFL